MKHFLPLVLLFTIALASCKATPTKPVDPCADYPKMCWGQAGTIPTDNPVCQRLVECSDWEMLQKQ